MQMVSYLACSSTSHSDPCILALDMRQTSKRPANAGGVRFWVYTWSAREKSMYPYLLATGASSPSLDCTIAT